MIAREQQKAILEAMLFVSPRPVTLAQMMRRIRTVIRQQSPQSQSDIDILAETPLFAEAVLASPLAVGSECENIIAGEIDNDEPDELISDGVDALEQLLDKKRELDDDVNRDEIKTLLLEIQAHYNRQECGVELVQVAKGWQFRTKYEISLLIRDEIEEAPTRLSPSSLEVLSIVAYQQPVTRQKIDEVRGVDSGGVLKTLLEKGFLKLVGRSEEPGKPLIYGTSPKFLEVFGLPSLKELPSLADLESLQMASHSPESSPNLDEDATESLFAFEDAEISSNSEPALDDADMGILTELDESLKTLRTIEKDIFEKPASTDSDAT
jgi:segregation and condensation protein B